ncbi:uncharacterized protein N7515_004415 [Penicillium bovifimosum]|uniref:Protein kinase domain-containing protein n=1 Tax=Penicillium bovifimosum TaxID=126998 RepID=A0A9W9L3V9_9EURO|nr:uncharacterized protein N7515_004415 [Penicillium bovifimosum]KAJ5135137.1 hypothetical protein N7515_004415 [Penicillium bovifimosum]
MSTRPNSGQQLEVLESNEVYEDSDKGFHFAGTLVVYQMKGNLYHAMLKARYSSPSNINTEDFMNIIQIPSSAYNPKFSVEFTPAPQSLPNNYFVKKPQLISYDRISQGPRPDSIAEDLLKEARFYELLKQRPHPNIAKYLGCQVSDGTITGLCLERYPHTLMEEVNPRGLMKRKLRSTRQATEDYSSVLTDIESGIRHLHSLGWVHNDINPSNIMIENHRAIIIDFGSCRRLGDSLEDVGRTYEWYDEKVQHSLFENDLNALEEIRIWLGISSRAFQFGA